MTGYSVERRSRPLLDRQWNTLGRTACPLILVLAFAAAGCGASATPATPSELSAKEIARQSLAKIDGELTVTGLQRPVEIIRDTWGVPHIFAQNTEDLFFAQGYVMAEDRLWELDWWRRTYDGHLAEAVGPSAFERDRLARLLMYRGPWDDREWASYHADGKRIVQAFANGINAFIDQNANNLPVEFKLTGITPGRWTPETVLLRESTFGEAVGELRLAMNVARQGVKEANRLSAPDPWDDLKVPAGLDVNLITEDVIAATRPSGPLPRPPLVAEYQHLAPRQQASLLPDTSLADPGSNNWVIGPRMSPTGKPLVVNDPHRQVTNPSLRYVVHLNAPGWDVIGAAQPPFLGVSFGHNDRVAWSMTIVGTDFQDIFVEQLNPSNPNEVIVGGKPEPLRVVKEEIKIKGESPRVVELKFGPHGPIFYVDEKNHKAYALRSIFSEPGTASYIGGLKLDQVRNCKEFLDALSAWKAPSENLTCGDVDGNIGWQPTALTPKRKGDWVGRLPVPGDGKYDWDGFRSDLPREYNPERGFIATANNNIHPKGYWPPIMFKTSRDLEFERITRIRQVIKPGQMFSMEDSKRLHRDVYSLRGAHEQPLFRGWIAKSADVERARDAIAKWDANLTVDSLGAALYTTWRNLASSREGPRGRGASEASTEAPTQATLEADLEKTVAKLTKDFGPDWSQWRYGRVHTQAFPHPILKEFDLPTVERRGGNGSVAADGATYREIIDLSNWDNSLTINVPGQSGQPESPFYGNLLPLWAKDEYFPMLYSRSAVDRNVSHTLTLKPAGR